MDFRLSNFDKNSQVNLELILDSIWVQLRKGAMYRKHPMHSFILSYIHDNAAESCYMINRGVDHYNRILSLHTDYRSKKVSAIKQNNNIQLLFYNYQEKIQIKINCIADINYQNNLTEIVWEDMKAMSKITYQNSLPKDMKFNNFQTYSEHLLIHNNKKELLKYNGYENFVIILLTVLEIEYSELNGKNSMQAKFLLRDNKKPEMFFYNF